MESMGQYKWEYDWLLIELEQHAKDLEDGELSVEFFEKVTKSGFVKGLVNLPLLLDVHNRSVKTMQRVLGLDEFRARRLTQDLILKSIALELQQNSTETPSAGVVD